MLIESIFIRESSRAIRAELAAMRERRSIFLKFFLEMKSAGEKSDTWAPSLDGNRDVSKEVIGPIPESPSKSFCEKAVFPTPRGVTMPIPVTTTLLLMDNSPFSKSSKDNGSVIATKGKGVGENDRDIRIS